ncbi:hypothetical protein MtrunA17_Chr5g0431321 [Medicago truncatula]|uniref:Uncharacterized protein n=1 Tax=Medicago truncatula TaxID=3880 RepID=G7KEC7_MEDTR|nr:hypothetical protein MTR_5g072730 [Medicago truncatula]RHN56610.1 hypothetical protein MtrunA17_Chr5g0431321 [Medicago truncatula]
MRSPATVRNDPAGVRGAGCVSGSVFQKMGWRRKDKAAATMVVVRGEIERMKEKAVESRGWSGGRRQWRRDGRCGGGENVCCRH